MSITQWFLTFFTLSRSWRAENTRGCRLQSTLPRTASTARLRRLHSKLVYRQFFLRTRASDCRAAQQSPAARDLRRAPDGWWALHFELALNESLSPFREL